MRVAWAILKAVLVTITLATLTAGVAYIALYYFRDRLWIPIIGAYALAIFLISLKDQLDKESK